MAAVKKILLGLLALVAALWLAHMWYLLTHPTTPMTPPTTQTLTVGSLSIEAEVARTEEARAKGLAGRTSLSDGAGMLFIFETEDYWPFWMKDTLISLDILWVAEGGTIVTIVHNVQPESYPEVFKPERPARFVLELPAGYAKKHGIAEGDKIGF